MISAEDKKFFFQQLANKVFETHADLATAHAIGIRSSEPVSPELVLKYYVADSKFTGLCIPYGYFPEWDFDKEIVKLRSNTSGRIVAQYG